MLPYLVLFAARTELAEFISAMSPFPHNSGNLLSRRRACSHVSKIEIVSAR